MMCGVDILWHPSMVTGASRRYRLWIAIFSEPKLYKHILPVMCIEFRCVMRHWRDKAGVIHGPSRPTDISHMKFGRILGGDRLWMSRKMWGCWKVE